MHGPYEVFAQDSVYILQYLEEDRPYRWNPQSHLLYHWGIEKGHELWRRAFGRDATTFAYLKLVTASCGALFLALMAWLLRELKLEPARRIALLLLCGCSLTAWFHFAAFETHALALPGVALYLIALVRLRDRPARSYLDRALFVASLLLCGWTRFDLFRLAGVSALLLVLPALGRHRRSLSVDLTLVAVLGFAGNVALAREYLGLTFEQALTAPFERKDRKDLRERLGRVGNLDPANLVSVGRAVSLYSLVMPVEPPARDRSFLAPPIQHIELEWDGHGPYPSTGLFLEPARNLSGNGISLAAIVAGTSVLLFAVFVTTRRASRGDPVHSVLIAQALAGWIFYTWFNPFEPFLWAAEFMPPWIAIVADGSHPGGKLTPALIGFAALAIALHNAFAFYLSFS